MDGITSYKDFLEGRRTERTWLGKRCTVGITIRIFRSDWYSGTMDVSDVTEDPTSVVVNRRM